MESQARYVRVRNSPQDPLPSPDRRPPFQSSSPPPQPPPHGGSSLWQPPPNADTYTNTAESPALFVPPTSSSPPPTSPAPPAPSLAGRTCFFLLGAGLLAAWNALITATDYFQAVYPGWHTDRMFTLAYLPLCLMTLAYAIRYPDLPPSSVRIRVGYGGFAAAMGAVPLLDAWLVGPLDNTSTPDTPLAAPPAGLIAVLICVAFVGACDGLCQGAVFGAAAQLPPPYTHAVVSGTAISGLLVCLLRITSKASFEAAGAAAAGDEDGDPAARLRAGTRLYFAIAGLLSLSCLIIYDLVLPRLPGGLRRDTPSPHRQQQQHHHHAHHQGPHTHAATAPTTAPGTDAQEHTPLLQPPLLQTPAREQSIELGSRTDSGSWGGGSGHGGGVFHAGESSWGGQPGRTTRGGGGCDGTDSGGSAATDAYDTALPSGVPQAAQLPLSGPPPRMWLEDTEPYTTATTATVFNDIRAMPPRSDSDATRVSGPLRPAGRPHRGCGRAAMSPFRPRPSLFGWCGRAVLPPQVANCLALCWPLCGALVLTYGATLAIFPGFLAEDVQSALLGDWYPLLLITAFNAADFIGKTLPCVQPASRGGGLSGVPAQQQHPQVAGDDEVAEAVRPLLIARRELGGPHAGDPDEIPSELEGCGGDSSAVRGQGSDETIIDTTGVLQHQHHLHQHQQQHDDGDSNGNKKHNRHNRNRLVSVRNPVAARVMRVFGAVAGGVLQPLRSPRGLLAVAAVRGCVALPAFLCADLLGAPAGVMAVLTAALGVSNGYLTSQVLTMGPSSVLGTDPARVPGGTGDQEGGGKGGRDGDRLEVAAVGVGKKPTGQQQTGGGLSGGVVEEEGTEEGGGEAGGHADAEVVENLLVLSLVGGLNLGAYLGWLWLL